MKFQAGAKLILLVLLLVATACGSLYDTAPGSPTEAPEPSLPATPTEGVISAETEPETEQAQTPTAEPTATPEPLAALVNGQALPLADYELALAQYKMDLLAQGVDPTSTEGQAEMAEAGTWILNVLIEQVLTEQAAQAAGVEISDADVDAYMQTIIEENGGEEAFYAKLAERGETYESAWREVRAGLIGMAMTSKITESISQTAEHVRARHILVDTMDEAESILAQLQNGADFASLAKAYSLDVSTKDTGGDLGFFPRGILVVPEVEEAAFALQPGQLSEVVHSALGYHIVQVVEREPARQLTQDNLYILQDRAVQEWVEGLWAQADIQRFVEAVP